MAQALKTLEPTTSPLHFFGSEVRRLRQHLEMSQAELGRKLLHSKDLVGKIEAAQRVPSRDFVNRCDEILGAEGALRRMWPMLERERHLRASKEPARPATAEAHFPEATDRPVLDWLLSPAGESRRHSFDQDAAIDAADMLLRLRQVDQVHGAGESYPDVADFLRHSLQPLAVRAPNVAVGFLELAGYEAVDLGADGTAQQHYLGALQIATAGGERLYGGYIVGVSLAHLALHCGAPSHAVRLATAALLGTERCATPAVRAAFHIVLARSYARLGDEGACTTALRQVETDLERSRAADEPAWIAYFGEADLADEKAHCFFDLGLHPLTQREARSAIDLLKPTRVRRLAIDTALLASSLARTGDIDEASWVARQAVDHAANTASFRSAHRIALMTAEIHRYADVRTAQDLAEYTRFRLPSIPTLSSGDRGR